MTSEQSVKLAVANMTVEEMIMQSEPAATHAAATQLEGTMVGFFLLIAPASLE